MLIIIVTHNVTYSMTTFITVEYMCHCQGAFKTRVLTHVDSMTTVLL